jgi:hypothetical protein
VWLIASTWVLAIVTPAASIASVCGQPLRDEDGCKNKKGAVEVMHRRQRMNARIIKKLGT